jgi:hypothetical protein
MCELRGTETLETYPLLVRLVNGIQSILDCYTLEVSCCHLLS